MIPLSVQINDNSGKPVKGAEVTLDGSQKIVTDAKGQVSFSNVLTGDHVLLVSYKGQTTSRNISLDINHIGDIVAVKLPSASQVLNAPLIIVTTVIIIILAVTATFVLLKLNHSSDPPFVKPSVAIHGVIAGSVGATPTGLT